MSGRRSVPAVRVLVFTRLRIRWRRALSSLHMKRMYSTLDGDLVEYINGTHEHARSANV